MIKNNNLTKRQENLLNIIKNLTYQKDELPTLKEIYKETDWKNINSIYGYLKRLEEKNYLKYNHDTKRITWIKDFEIVNNNLKIHFINEKGFIEINKNLLKGNHNYIAFKVKNNKLKEFSISYNDILIFDNNLTWLNNKLVLVKFYNGYQVLEYKKKDNFIYLSRQDYTHFLINSNIIVGKLCLVIRKY